MTGGGVRAVAEYDALRAISTFPPEWALLEWMSSDGPGVPGFRERQGHRSHTVLFITKSRSRRLSPGQRILSCPL